MTEIPRPSTGRRALVTVRVCTIVLTLLATAMCVSTAIDAARALGLSGARGTFTSAGCFDDSTGDSTSYDCSGTFTPRPGSGGRADGQAWLESSDPLPPGQRVRVVQSGDGGLDAYGFVPAIGAFLVLGLGVAAFGCAIALFAWRPRQALRDKQPRVRPAKPGVFIAIGGVALFVVCLVVGLANWLVGLIS